MLTYSAQDKTYRVWDMTNYDELYKLPEDDITEIKISPGIMLLILSRSPSGVRRRLPSSRGVAAPLQPSHRPLGAAARTSRAPAALSARHCRRLPRQGHVPLKILSIEDGTVLQRFNHLLHRTKKVEFIEQFNEKLLVKQARARPAARPAASARWRAALGTGLTRAAARLQSGARAGPPS